MNDEHAKGPPRDDKKDPFAAVPGPPPEEFSNPSGLGETECDIQPPEKRDEPCDDSEVEDMALGESAPGFGIAGYEGEEVGGG